MGSQQLRTLDIWLDESIPPAVWLSPEWGRICLFQVSVQCSFLEAVFWVRVGGCVLFGALPYLLAALSRATRWMTCWLPILARCLRPWANSGAPGVASEQWEGSLWPCAYSLGSSWLRTISYVCIQGKTLAIQAGRLNQLATTDCTSMASHPSCSEVTLLRCRTPSIQPEAPGWF